MQLQEYVTKQTQLPEDVTLQEDVTTQQQLPEDVTTQKQVLENVSEHNVGVETEERNAQHYLRAEDEGSVGIQEKTVISPPHPTPSETNKL